MPPIKPQPAPEVKPVNDPPSAVMYLNRRICLGYIAVNSERRPFRSDGTPLSEGDTIGDSTIQYKFVLAGRYEVYVEDLPRDRWKKTPDAGLIKT